MENLLGDFSLTTLMLLALLALLAGFLDTLAGGGGLLTVPGLLLAGLSPLQAVATNKFQASLGTATASYWLLRGGSQAARQALPKMPFALLGGIAGALCVQALPVDLLAWLIPLVLFFVGSYFLLQPYFSMVRTQARIGAVYYRRVVIPLIGFYDGILGPGTGSFFALAGVLGRGQSLPESTSAAKVLNFASNVASLCVFVASGGIVYIVGLVMLLGQAVGSALGARLLLRGGGNWLRPLVVSMCFILCAVQLSQLLSA